MTSKETLIQSIYKTYKDVKLEDGVGLLEGQGIDDCATPEVREKTRMQDEKNNWQKISLANIYNCTSSLAFFDAKGMRFHLPQFLLFALEAYKEEQFVFYEKGAHILDFISDISFHLYYQLDDDYSLEKFSALNHEQVQCVIDFLQWQLDEKEAYFKLFCLTSIHEQNDYCQEIENAIIHWKLKL